MSSASAGGEPDTTRQVSSGMAIPDELKSRQVTAASRWGGGDSRSKADELSDVLRAARSLPTITETASKVRVEMVKALRLNSTSTFE